MSLFFKRTMKDTKKKYSEEYYVKSYDNEAPQTGVFKYD